ncbi:MAG: GxxExxY protein [Candidatus Harrisonbacteria bacterium]|nr:GxxExxY protein [Candidatus Harrisonbacteria bacterium]
MQIKHEYTNTPTELIYPELSYKIVGAAFNVYNNLGWGHDEKTYQRALAIELEKAGLNYEREKFVSIDYNGEKIAKKFLDFLVDNKIIVELKIVPKLGYVHINQVVSYLKGTNMKLAIVIYFLQDGVRFKRIVNPY